MKHLTLSPIPYAAFNTVYHGNSYGSYETKQTGALIQFSPLEEDTNIFDQLEDQEIAQKVADQYNSGDLAAWFCAHVRVTYKGIEEDDYLGCCSYESFKQFIEEENGYFADMVNECVVCINRAIDLRNQETRKAWKQSRIIANAKRLVDALTRGIELSECLLTYDIIRALDKLRKHF